MDSTEDAALSYVRSPTSWYTEFADKLISENFLLTALEFHAELTESGKEVTKLKDFFSNPGNFEHQAANKPEVASSTSLPRSSSQATLDSLDLTRFSEDGERSNDDRVAVLEFELRKAKETITALRANLTVAAESDNKHNSEDSADGSKTQHQHQNSVIKPHEQRALNFLINEYLLHYGYKLTSITFADENENQDFEDWDDVGLNISRPLELLTLYREGLKNTGYASAVSTQDFECQVSLYDEMQHNVHINELEAEIFELNNKFAAMELEFSKKIQNLETRRSSEFEMRQSITPDPEYFEIIDTVKSREESETKSDRSNGDWTKIGDKFKKESIDLKSDNHSNYETVSVDEKVENQSGLFESPAEVNESISCENKRVEDSVEEIESEPNSEPLKLSDNFNETISDALDEDLEADCDVRSSKTGSISDINVNNITDMSVNLEADGETNTNTSNQKKSNADMFDNLENTREVPNAFRKKLLENCDMTIPLSTDEILLNNFQDTPLNKLSLDQLINILSSSLPKIIPNIILNKREEITPLLVLSVCLNQNSSTRDKLLNLLFNLKKRPQPEERQVILRALLSIAQVMGPNMVESEVLPQSWEQITHKYVERRMLVAESCFVLAPYVSEPIRNSLIVSMVQQLLQDREASIRKASVNVIALLIVLVSDEDKYTQYLDICLQVLQDESNEVLESVKYLLYPTLAQWSFTLKKLHSDLLPKLLLKFKKEKSLCIINVLEILLPYLIMSVADSDHLAVHLSQTHPSPVRRAEFAKLCKHLCDPVLFYKGSLKLVMSAFDYYCSEPEFKTSKWAELDWVLKEFIPGLLEPGNELLEETVVLTSLISTVRHLCVGLGGNVTKQKIKPLLMEKLQECETALVAGEECRYSIIPIYLVGVLSTDPEALQEMSNTLHRFICALPLCGASLVPLQVAVEMLSQYQSWQILVLDSIWEGVVHQRPLVRSAAATLFQSTIPYISDALLSTKVVPALVTLSSDPETSVRTCSIPALGMLTNCREKGIKDKVYMTFQTLLQDPGTLDNHVMVIQLVKTIKVIYENCDRQFKEEVAVPQLAAFSAMTSQAKNGALIETLTETFETVSYSHSPLSYQCITTALLPGLRCLESVSLQLNLPYTEHLMSMVKEVERRCAGEGVSKSAATTPISEGKRSISNVMSTHVVVEDVKSRVTKIFNTRPNTLQNVSGIFKKKT